MFPSRRRQNDHYVINSLIYKTHIFYHTFSMVVYTTKIYPIELEIDVNKDH